MYCKFLKLTSGENLIVTTADECTELLDKKYIEVTEPVEIQSMKMPYAGGVVESYIMQPWLKMSAKEVLKIPAQSILIATNLMEKAEVQYKQFILEYEEVTVTSEDEFEDEYDEPDDELEEDDDYDSRTSSRDRTYH